MELSKTHELSNKERFTERTVFENFTDKIELYSISNELPICTLIDFLIENVEKVFEDAITSVISIQKIIVCSQMNQQEAQNLSPTIQKLFECFTLIPKAISKFKKQPEFLILETFQQYLEGLEMDDRLTIKNLLQIKFQTSYQETFFKNNQLQNMCIETLQNLEEILLSKHEPDFFSEQNQILMSSISNSQIMLLKI
jgi:hypothetical protein